MKRVFLLTLSMFAVAICAFSCTKNPEDIIPSIECDNTIDAPNQGGTFTVTVQSPVPWEASVDDSRLTLSPDAGEVGTTTLSVEIPRLLDVTPCQYAIVLSNKEYQIKKEITVIQQGLSQEDLQEFAITYTTPTTSRSIKNSAQMLSMPMLRSTLTKTKKGKLYSTNR